LDRYVQIYLWGYEARDSIKADIKAFQEFVGTVKPLSTLRLNGYEVDVILVPRPYDEWRKSSCRRYGRSMTW